MDWGLGEAAQWRICDRCLGDKGCCQVKQDTGTVKWSVNVHVLEFIVLIGNVPYIVKQRRLKDEYLSRRDDRVLNIIQ